MQQLPILVGLGEVLWDVFPDGPRFGGAPTNFACSAAELARGQYAVSMAGAVGNDELGHRALEAFRDHRVNADSVERLPFPTGTVLVTLDELGQASYQFAANAAWDHLPWSDKLAQLASRAAVVCFGTLAQRDAASRQTIQRFVASTSPDCLRLLDVNLRSPFWDREAIVESLALANALKLNDAELPVIAELLGLHGSDEALLAQILQRCSLNVIGLTRGASGALLLRSSGERSDLAGRPVNVVDTVGAGDAFAAALALGVVRGMSLDAVNHWASNVAGFVCTQAGATPRIPDNLLIPN